jgi:hypothetical protein
MKLKHKFKGNFSLLRNYYLKRAIVAQMGLGANSPEDAIHPLSLGRRGRPLDGANKYTITFEVDATRRCGHSGSFSGESPDLRGHVRADRSPLEGGLR